MLLHQKYRRAPQSSSVCFPPTPCKSGIWRTSPWSYLFMPFPSPHPPASLLRGWQAAPAPLLCPARPLSHTRCPWGETCPSTQLGPSLSPLTCSLMRKLVRDFKNCEKWYFYLVWVTKNSQLKTPNYSSSAKYHLSAVTHLLWAGWASGKHFIATYTSDMQGT